MIELTSIFCVDNILTNSRNEIFRPLYIALIFFFRKKPKKVVANDFVLCYNNFCPLERGHGSQAVSGFPKKDLEKTSKNFKKAVDKHLKL